MGVLCPLVKICEICFSWINCNSDALWAGHQFLTSAAGAVQCTVHTVVMEVVYFVFLTLYLMHHLHIFHVRPFALRVQTYNIHFHCRCKLVTVECFATACSFRECCQILLPLRILLMHWGFFVTAAAAVLTQEDNGFVMCLLTNKRRSIGGLVVCWTAERPPPSVQHFRQCENILFS
jgi:hypothetical protein